LMIMGFATVRDHRRQRPASVLRRPGLAHAGRSAPPTSRAASLILHAYTSLSISRFSLAGFLMSQPAAPAPDVPAMGMFIGEEETS
jgi:hypothetical protein